MISGRVISCLALLLVSSVPSWAEDASTGAALVQDVGFSYATPKSRVFITFNKEVTFEKTVSEADKQVIIDVPNAIIGKKFSRRIPTTDQKTNLVMVSPYQSENRVRLTLQLRENGGIEVSQDGKTITALIDNKQSAVEKKADEAADLSDSEKQKSAPDAAKPEEAKADVPTDAAKPAAEDKAAPSTGTDTAVASGGGNESIDQFMKSQDSHQYLGKHIWLQVQDTELADVFRVISEASEFNILLSDNVKGRVMLNLTDIPWDQALDIILRSYHLVAEREGNVMRISTLAAITAEREAEAAAQKASVAAEPLVVKIFPISYAKIEDLSTIIRDFMTKDTSGLGVFGGAPFAPLPQPGAAGASGAGTPRLPGSIGPLRGSIQIDSRTNSLVVRDTPSTIEKIKRIVKELDAPTPQILIEGKFVDVTEADASDINGRLFVSNREADATGLNFTFPPSNNNFAAGFNTDISASGPAVAPSVLGGGSGMTLGFVPKAALLPGIGEIGALLQILEGESKGRVISSPRVVTQNKETAMITSGASIFGISGAVGQGGAAGAGTANASAVTAQTTLNVTPQVTNDGSVLLKLAFNQDSPDTTPSVNGAALTLQSKSITTTVVVDSGGTVVIGGAYSSTHNEIAQGIPILRNLPIIGPLFGRKLKINKKDELFIFITPRVLNDKEAGLRG